MVPNSAKQAKTSASLRGNVLISIMCFWEESAPSAPPIAIGVASGRPPAAPKEGRPSLIGRTDVNLSRGSPRLLPQGKETAPGRSRTCNTELRTLLLYPFELQAHNMGRIGRGPTSTGALERAEGRLGSRVCVCVEGWWVWGASVERWWRRRAWRRRAVSAWRRLRSAGRAPG